MSVIKWSKTINAKNLYIEQLFFKYAACELV